MKAVILAGGIGTRISEESGIKPKPVIEAALQIGAVLKEKSARWACST